MLLPGVFISSLHFYNRVVLNILATGAYYQTIPTQDLPSKAIPLYSLLDISIDIDPRLKYPTSLSSTLYSPPQRSHIHHPPPTTMPSISNPFSRLNSTSSASSSDTASINTTSSTSSWTKLLQKNTPVATYSSINSNTSTTEPSQQKKSKETLSPGEKQKIRQKDRISMQTLATHAAMR